MNTGSFSLGLKAMELKLEARQRDLKRAVGLKLFGAVIQDTPVDTGRLRSNWQTSLRTPDKGVSSTNPSQAISKMASVTGSATVKESLLMCNSLPYVRRIEYDGWSHTKAPRGMMHRNVKRFRQLLSQQLRVVKGGR